MLSLFEIIIFTLACTHTRSLIIIAILKDDKIFMGFRVRKIRNIPRVGGILSSVLRNRCGLRTSAKTFDSIFFFKTLFVLCTQ